MNECGRVGGDILLYSQLGNEELLWSGYSTLLTLTKLITSGQEF